MDGAGRGTRYLIPGQIDGEALALPLPNRMYIGLLKEWPEAPLLIAVPGEIKDAVDNWPGQK